MKIVENELQNIRQKFSTFFQKANTTLNLYFDKNDFYIQTIIAPIKRRGEPEFARGYAWSSKHPTKSALGSIQHSPAKQSLPKTPRRTHLDKPPVGSMTPTPAHYNKCVDKLRELEQEMRVAQQFFVLYDYTNNANPNVPFYKCYNKKYQTPLFESLFPTFIVSPTDPELLMVTAQEYQKGLETMLKRNDTELVECNQLRVGQNTIEEMQLEATIGEFEQFDDIARLKNEELKREMIEIADDSGYIL